MFLFEICPDTADRAVQRNLDRVGLHAGDLADFSRTEVGAVAQSQKIASTVVQAVDCSGDLQSPHGLALEILVRSLFGHLEAGSRRTAAQSVVDTATSDTEKPGQGASTGIVIA